LRRTGDFKTSLTYYTKVLELQPDHKAAHEYLGELYIQTGDTAKAKQQLDVLAHLCPAGCEEREDLENALKAKSASN
jgi:cytochrome c-type biogenesis protein CcmH/NrfG